MPQTFTVESQAPDCLHVTLSWGRLVDAPPANELVRLAPGEVFTIPEGHATSIRTTEGWQQGYALNDTAVTGPVDISKPTAMTRRDFAPGESSSHSTVLGVFTLGAILLTAGLTQAAAEISYEAMATVFFVGVTATMLVLAMMLRFMRKSDERNGQHACADETRKTFWREELELAQTQPIRKVRAT